MLACNEVKKLMKTTNFVDPNKMVLRLFFDKYDIKIPFQDKELFTNFDNELVQKKEMFIDLKKKYNGKN